MRIGELCTRDVVFCRRDTSAVGVADLMRKGHVGDLLVIDELDGERVPVGIITDRDLVIEVMAKEIDPRDVTAGDIMGRELAVATEDEDFYETIQRMRAKGIRRMPVVNAKGGLVGIATLDDLVEFLAETLGEVSRISRRQEVRERSARG